jgi:ribosomal-protein-alanine N-acetyltransferase
VIFSLRDYQTEDFAVLWSMDQACFPPGIAYSRWELGLYIRRPKALTLVAEERSPASSGKAEGAQPRILGFLVAEVGRNQVGHIITIDVLPEARRAGVGTSLLDAAERRLRNEACSKVYLETAVDNLSAISFYKRLQYFVVNTIPGYYSNGVDALVLEKDLLSRAQAS